MTIDGAGRLVIADPFGFDLTVLDAKDGELIAKYGAPGTVDGQFVYPSSVAYDPSSRLVRRRRHSERSRADHPTPDSGGSTLAGAGRRSAGPLRACIIPLLLILLAIVAGIVYRMVKRRKKQPAASRRASG